MNNDTERREKIQESFENYILSRKQFRDTCIQNIAKRIAATETNELHFRGPALESVNAGVLGAAVMVMIPKQDDSGLELRLIESVRYNNEEENPQMLFYGLGQNGDLKVIHETCLTATELWRVYRLIENLFKDPNVMLVDENYLVTDTRAKEQRTVEVEWDTDGRPLEDCGLLNEVNVPSYVADDEMSDYLSDVYGYCVSSWRHVPYGK